MRDFFSFSLWEKGEFVRLFLPVHIVVSQGGKEVGVVFSSLLRGSRTKRETLVFLNVRSYTISEGNTTRISPPKKCVIMYIQKKHYFFADSLGNRPCVH